MWDVWGCSAGRGGGEAQRAPEAAQPQSQPTSQQRLHAAHNKRAHLRHLFRNLVCVGLVGDGNQDLHLAAKRGLQDAQGQSDTMAAAWQRSGATLQRQPILQCCTSRQPTERTAVHPQVGSWRPLHMRTSLHLHAALPQPCSPLTLRAFR